MMTGRSQLPPGFNANELQLGDWPAMTAVGAYATRQRNNLPRAAILPEKITLSSEGGVFPGQFGGMMGRRNDPWLIEATTHTHPDHGYSGAYPTIYQALGIPRKAHWHDGHDRPHPIYHAEPIQKLTGDRAEAFCPYLLTLLFVICTTAHCCPPT
jgi:hypothetical protein